jgi:hypothetical protein
VRWMRYRQDGQDGSGKSESSRRVHREPPGPGGYHACAPANPQEPLCF